MRPYQRPRQIQSTQENHGLMMTTKMQSKITKKAERQFEKHPTSDNSEISVSSERKLEEHQSIIVALLGVILFPN